MHSERPSEGLFQVDSQWSLHANYLFSKSVLKLVDASSVVYDAIELVVQHHTHKQSEHCAYKEGNYSHKQVESCIVA